MQGHASARDPAPDSGRLADLLRRDPEEAAPALARSLGRDLAVLAYLVLQHRGAAETAAAGAIAQAVRRASAGSHAESGPRLWAELCAETLRLALEGYRASREVDALSALEAPRVRVELSPRQRALAAGTVLGGLTANDLAVALGSSSGRLADELREAEGRTGSARALAEWARSQSVGLSLSVGEPQLRRALASDPAGRRTPALPRWALAALPLAGALVVVAVLLAWAGTPGADAPGEDAVPLGGGAAASPTAPPTRAPGGGGTVSGGVLLDSRLSLADCDIQPADSELAYRGWLMLGDLAPSADPIAATTPVFAMVTDDTAEWVGWQTSEGRPMFPRPVGRLGCAVDPVAGTTTVFAVPGGWEPPRLVDGCPASPLLRFGGDRQIGGPGAFALLPWEDRSWWADDRSVRILVRIAPAPPVGAEISARAVPLGPGRPLELGIDGPPLRAGRPPSSSHYVWLTDAHFSDPGCWLVSVAVDGETVGQAVVPVTRRPG